MQRAIGAALGLLLLLAGPLPAAAQFVGENLLVSMPQGFKLGYQASRNGLDLQEWVPDGETVQDWTEMVTVQIFRGRGDLDPAQALGGIQKGWLQACPGSQPAPVGTGQVDGYPAAGMVLRCPRTAQAGQPESTAFRAIRGRDSFYVVQRAVRALPDGATLEQMQRYLAGVSLCDSRSATAPCPKLDKDGLRR